MQSGLQLDCLSTQTTTTSICGDSKTYLWSNLPYTIALLQLSVQPLGVSPIEAEGAFGETARGLSWGRSWCLAQLLPFYLWGSDTACIIMHEHHILIENPSFEAVNAAGPLRIKRTLMRLYRLRPFYIVKMA